MSDGKLADIQMSSFIAKDVGGVSVGYFSFSGQPTANDTIQIGARVIEWDGAGANLNVAIGGTLALTLAAAVAAINADGTILVDAIVGANDACLNLVARTVAAGNLALAMPVDVGGVTVRSGATMLGSKAEAVAQIFRESYTITADDVAEMAACAQNAEIVIAAVPLTSAPATTNITVWDTTGLLHPFTNLLFVWRQLSANYYGLFLEDNGPVLAAGDTIEIIAAVA
jgi:hypothetical protein